jgi:choline dehydrogenase-like flavoprotein
MREVMRRHSGKVDVCIVGAGAAGSTLAKTLAEGGMSVVVLEAGRWFDTRKDFLNDELSMLGPLDWDDLRISGGSDPLALGRTTTGKGVGGSTVHFTAVKLRLHPEDFRLRSRTGQGADWPLTYDDLERYFDFAEEFVGVSGPLDMPWPGSRRRRYPQGELPLQAVDQLFHKAMDKLGIKWRMTPHAVLTGAKDGRAPCMYYGFCVNGCKSDAKGSALVTWVPAAVKAGAEIREECFAHRIECDSSGRAARVLYYDADGSEQAQEAERIIISGYSIETPRLLLNSANGAHPSGLANSSGVVGKYLHVHPASEIVARFEQPVDHFVTPPVGILTQDFYDNGAPDVPLGYTINRYAHFPIDFITSLISSNNDLWGPRLHEVMDQYTHWGVLAAMVEQVPQEHNLVKLANQTDQHGIPVAHVEMSYTDWDKQLLEASRAKMEQIGKEAGAVEIISTHYNDHVLGTCRMGNDPATSVVGPDCRSHDVPNLYICDGSVFPSAGAVNPSLTIEAIALRTADIILGKPIQSTHARTAVATVT